MGAHNRFRTIGDLQFDEDIGDIVLHRFEAQAQRMCNRRIVQSSCHQVQDETPPGVP